MNTLDIIDHHMIIRDTVGYEVLAEVDLMDMPKVMEFLKIVYNYQRMKQHQWDKAEDNDWDEYLKAVKEEEPQPGWEDPMIAHLDEEEKDWMDDYYDDYLKLQASGMFWEFHPDWTGVWLKDKYAFCHEQLMKKK